MAAPLCGEHTSLLIVWHPAVQVTISVLTVLTPIYKQSTERGGMRGLVSRLQQQWALGLYSVVCWPQLIVSRNTNHPSCHHQLDKELHLLLHTGLQIPARRQCHEPVDGSQRWMRRGGEWEQQTRVNEYVTPDYRVIKAQPAPSIILGDRPSIHTGVKLTVQWPTQGAWPILPH